MYKKYLILLGFILALGYSAFAAPAPNSCDNPTAITYSTGVQSCVAGSNTGAAAGPDFAGNNCYDFTQETVWYEVTTTGSSATIDILLTSATLTSPYFSVFTTTDCLNYTIINCTQGTSGSASNTVSISTSTTYLIAVSDQNGLDGNFNLCITVNDDNSACNTNNVLSVTATSMGSPLAGPYQAGEIVSFCYTITDYQQINCNYLQGIVPTFGDCWDPVSFTAQGAPVTITTPLATAAVLTDCPPGPPCAWNACVGDPAGTWSWFPAGSATYNNINNPSIPNGTSIGAGWFFLTTYSPTTGSCTADPTDPDNSYGDGSLNCGENTYDWTVCFQLQTRTDGVSTCTNGLTDCSVSIKTYADGEIGVWDNVGCLADISSASPSTIYACCSPTPAVYNVSGGGTLCNGDPGVSINLSDSENGVTYELYLNGVATGTTISGTGSAISFNNQTTAGTYTVAGVIDATSCGDLMSGSATIIVSGTAPTVTVSPASSSICSGQSVALTATVTPVPATVPVTFTNSTSVAIPDFNPAGISSNITVSGVDPTTLSSGMIVSLCFTITHQKHADIGNSQAVADAIYIQSPSGTQYNFTPLPTNGASTITYCFPIATLNSIIGNANGTWTLHVEDNKNTKTGTLDSWSITFNSTNITTFTWSPTTDMTGSGTLTPTVSPTSTTAYTISATDQTGCAATSTSNITVSPGITLSTTQTNIACFGNLTGAVNLTVSGGTSPFTYIWTGGAVTQDLSGVAAGTYSVTVTDALSCTNTTTVTLTQPASALTASITSQTNVKCFGDATGSATLTRGGGTSPYTFLWTGGAVTQNLTNVVAGIYTVTVTDANLCTVTASVTITQPAAALSTSVSGVDADCFGASTGSASTTTTGGTSPYTYIWNDPLFQTTANATGLTQGTYNVTVTDSLLCTTTISATITEPAEIILTSVVTNSTCGNPDGEIDLTVAGGITPITFLWSNLATSEDIITLLAGAYSVTVTDANSCTETHTANVADLGAPTATIDTSINVSCNGGNNGFAVVMANLGTPPYTYLWNDLLAQANDTAINLVANTYSVTVTDNAGCKASATIIITEPTALNISVTAQTNVSCNTGNDGSATVSVSGGTAGYTYLWNDPAAQTTLTASALTAGIYTVTVTDSNLCTDSVKVTIIEPALLTVTSSETNVTCYSLCNASSTANPTGGTSPYTYNWDDGQNSQTAINLCAGNYNLTVTDNKNCTVTLPVTITQPDTLTASIVGTMPNCNGGSDGNLDLIVVGGTTPFTFLWSPFATTEDLSGIPAGNYNVTITDNNSCTTTTLIKLSEPSILTSSISATNVSCQTLTDGTADLSVIGGTTPYTFLWSNDSTTEDINGLAIDTFYVTITDNNGCEAFDSIIITEPTALSAAINGYNLSCFQSADGVADLTVSGGTFPYSYLWDDVSASITEDLSLLSIGTYNVTVTDANGCTANDSVIITEPTVLTASITGTDVTCNGFSDGAADLTVTGGTTPYTFDWSTTETTEDISGLIAGNYDVTVTDVNSCTADTSVTISEPASALSASITSQTNVDCFGNANGSLTVTASNGTSGYTYDWSPDGFTGDLTSTYSDLTAQIYTVTVTDANLCTTTASATITQPVAALSASITSQTNVDCFGNATGSLTVTASNGTSGYTYDWSPNGFTGDGTVTYSALTAGIYDVTVTDVNLCTTTTSATITEPAILNADAGTNETICIGDTISLTASGGNSFLWSNAEITATISVTPITNTTFYVTVTDAIGCVGYDSVEVFVNLLPNADAGIDVAFCEGDSVTLTATGGISYIWSDLAGNTASVVVKPTSPQYYFVTVTDVNGCSNYDSTFVMYNPLPNANAGNNLSICYGNDTILSASGGTFFLWNTTETTSSITINPLSDSTYYVTVTDVNGCFDVDSVNVIVNSLPLANAGVNDTICNGDTITLTASGGTDYLWSNSENTASINVNPSTETTYIVTVTDSNGCTDTDDVIITVNSLPTPTIIGSLTYCIGSNAILSTENYSSYLWSNTDTTQNISADTLDNPISVTVTNSNGCVGVSSSVNLTASTSLSPVITGSLSYCAGNSTVLNAGIFTNYEWSTGETTQTINATIADNPISVTVSDASGCSGISSSVNVIENPNPNPVITGNLSYCAGSNTVLSVGTFDSYQWTTGATTQTINATIADNNPVISVVVYLGSCSAIATPVTVIENPNPNPIITGNLSYCAGSNTVLSVGTFDSYNWTTGATSQSINATIADNNPVISVVVTLGSCSAIATPVTVTESPNPVPSITGSLTYCVGNNAVLNVGAFDSYLWSTSLTTQSITATEADNPISVIVTNADGCMGYDTVNVVENTSLSPNISGNLSYCEGSNTTLDAGLYDSYNWSTTETTQTINVTAGTYDVTVYDSFGCSGTTSAIVIENANPTPEIIGDTMFCSGESTILTTSASYFSYSWSNLSTNDSINISPLNPITVKVTVTDVNSCFGVDSALVTVFSLPVANAGLDKNICYGDSTILTASGGVSFIWNTNETTSTIIVEPLSTTIYYITITNANGCKDNDEVVVNVNPQLVAAISATNVDCYGNNTGIADLTIAGGTSPYTFVWSNTATTEDISGLTIGNYDVTITDSKSCKISTSVTITEPQTLNTSIAGVDLLCNSSASGSADLTVTGGTTPYSFNWSNLAISEDLSGLSGGTYYVTVTDANNCQKIDSITINEPSALNNTFININNVICSSNTGSATASVSGGVSPYTYLWTGNQVSATAINLGGGMYYLTITDANSCTKIDSVNISSTPGGTANVTLLATNNCFGENIGSATASMSGGTSPFNYNWSNTATNDTISNLVAGVYTVTITDVNNCVSIDSVTITEPAEIIAIISQTAVSCYNETDGTATVTVSGGTSPYTYLWSDNQTTSTATGLSPNGYLVTVTDSLGCIIDTNITVNNAVIISISESHTNITCKGSNNGSIAVIVNGGTSPYSYSWSSGGNTNTIINVVAGIYTVTVTDFNTCIETRIITLTEPALSLQVSVTDVDADCFNENSGEATATVTSGVSPYTYLWSSNSQTTQTATGLLAGYHTVTVTDFSGCNAIGIINIGSPTQIEVVDSLTVITKTSCQGSLDGSISVTYSGGTPPYTYYWNNGKTSDKITDLAAGNYYLTVTDFNNCEEVDTFTVESNPVTCLDIPTAFTPNGDTYNDTWEIKYLYMYPSASIKVFNRWGQLVYECKDGCNPWDGTHNGKPLSFGPFTYIIDLNDGTDPINGVVTLIK